MYCSVSKPVPDTACLAFNVISSWSINQEKYSVADARRLISAIGSVCPVLIWERRTSPSDTCSICLLLVVVVSTCAFLVFVVAIRGQLLEKKGKKVYQGPTLVKLLLGRSCLAGQCKSEIIQDASENSNNNRAAWPHGMGYIAAGAALPWVPR